MLILLVLSLTILISGNILLFNGLETGRRTLQFVLAVSGSLFILLLSIFIGKSGWLEYLGRQAMPIYVLQAFSYAPVRMMLTRLDLNTPDGFFPLCICSIAGVLLPLIAYQLCRKIGKLDFIFYPGKYLKIP